MYADMRNKMKDAQDFDNKNIIFISQFQLEKLEKPKILKLPKHYQVIR